MESRIFDWWPQKVAVGKVKDVLAIVDAGGFLVNGFGCRQEGNVHVLFLFGLRAIKAAQDLPILRPNMSRSKHKSIYRSADLSR